MRQKNRNIPMSRLLWLLWFVCIGLAVVSVGTAFARYRDERREELVLQVREPERVLLGTIVDEEFIPVDSKNNRLEWDRTEDGVELQFAVANGVSETSYSARDQAIKLYMIGSAGIAVDGVPPKVFVTFVSQKGGGEEKIVQATASPIVAGTALHHTYGDGWLFTFNETIVDEERELTWELTGGRLSYIILTVVSDGEFSQSVNVLQPLIAVEAMKD